MPRLQARWPLALALSLCAASCGTNDNRLNTKKGEKVLSQWLEQQGIAPETVSCPRDIKMEKGTSFLCKAVIANASGTTIEIRVHQTGDTGDIQLEHASKLLISERVERGVGGQILDQTKKKVKVNCGDRVRIATPGTKFRCKVEEQNAGANRAETPAENFEMEITIEDADGNWQAQRV